MPKDLNLIYMPDGRVVNHALAAVVGLTRDAPLCLVAGGIETRAPLRFSLSSTGLDVRDALARIAQADPDGIDRPERRAAPDADLPTDRPDHAGRVPVQVQHGFAALAPVEGPRLRLLKPGIPATAPACWRHRPRVGIAAPVPLACCGLRL